MEASDTKELLYCADTLRVWGLNLVDDILADGKLALTLDQQARIRELKRPLLHVDGRLRRLLESNGASQPKGGSRNG